jgi:hypothetical protein
MISRHQDQRAYGLREDVDTHAVHNTTSNQFRGSHAHRLLVLLVLTGCPFNHPTRSQTGCCCCSSGLLSSHSWNAAKSSASRSALSSACIPSPCPSFASLMRFDHPEHRYGSEQGPHAPPPSDQSLLLCHGDACSLTDDIYAYITVCTAINSRTLIAV